MAKQGDILYQIEGTTLKPVHVRVVNDVPRETPEGESYPDVILTTEDGEGNVESNYASNYLTIPYLADVEATLAGCSAPVERPKS
jgi:hypothetical protein